MLSSVSRGSTIVSVWDYSKSGSLLVSKEDFLNGFIGRSSSKQVVEDRVLLPQKPGNLALVGLPCIGKSSFAHQALIERKQALLTSKFLPIWLDLATYQQDAINLVPTFFRSLVEGCMTELQQLQWVTEPIQRAANHVLNEEVSSGEGFGRLLRFFEK